MKKIQNDNLTLTFFCEVIGLHSLSSLLSLSLQRSSGNFYISQATVYERLNPMCNCLYAQCIRQGSKLQWRPREPAWCGSQQSLWGGKFHRKLHFPCSVQGNRQIWHLQHSTECSTGGVFSWKPAQFSSKSNYLDILGFTVPLGQHDKDYCIIDTSRKQSGFCPV